MSRLTVPQGAALSVGAVLGTGVIALAGAGRAGRRPGVAASPGLALVVLSVPLAATFAALGARYPDAGGVSTYVRRAFGARAAAVVGWCFYFAIPAGAPAAGDVRRAPTSRRRSAAASAPRCITAAVLMVGVTRHQRLAACGSPAGSSWRWPRCWSTLLVTATVTALPHARLANLQPFAPHGWRPIAPGGRGAGVGLRRLGGGHLARRRLPPTRPATCRGPPPSRSSWSACSTWPSRRPACSCSARPPATTERRWPSCSRSASAARSRVLTAGRGRAAHPRRDERLLRRRRPSSAPRSGRDGALPAWLARGSSAGEVPRRSLAVVAGAGASGALVVVVAGGRPEPVGAARPRVRSCWSTCSAPPPR